MSGIRNKLSVFEFQDYRCFLKANYEYSKKKNPLWSHQAWALSMGLADGTSILKIINGQRGIGPKIFNSLCIFFDFNTKEKSYFEDLVKIEKVKGDTRLSLAILQRMKKLNPNRDIRLIDDKTFSYLSNWWYLPLRQITRLSGFRFDYKWISSHFLFQITPSIVKEAYYKMRDLGVIKIDDKKNVSLTNQSLTTTNDVSSHAIKSYHESMLEKAQKALFILGPEDREITSQTLVMKKSDLPKAKEYLRNCMDKFEELFDCKDADDVYQLQVQLFPMTKMNQKQGEYK